MQTVQLHEIAHTIATQFHPQKIILFGSHAWGNPTPDSDVDLFILKETKNTRTEAQAIDGALFPRPFPIDIVVCTPDQLARRQQAGDTFVGKIMKEGMVLYGQ